MQQFHLLSSCRAMCLGSICPSRRITPSKPGKVGLLCASHMSLQNVFCFALLFLEMGMNLNRVTASTTALRYCCSRVKTLCSLRSCSSTSLMNTSAILWAFSAVQAVFSVRISLLGLPTVCGQLYCFLPVNTLMKMLPVASISFSV